MTRLLKDVFSVSASKVLMTVFGLATSIIIARSLGPEKNGVIAALLVYPSLFISFGSLGVRQSTVYFLGKKIYTEKEIKTAITQIWFFTSIISVLSCFCLISYFSNEGEDIWLVLLAISPITFNLFNTYNTGIFLGRNDVASFSKVNWIPSFVILFLTVICVLVLKLDIKGYFFALIGGPMVVSLILFNKNKFLSFFTLNFNWLIIKKMISLGVVYALGLLIVNLNLRVDVILLDKLSTPYEVGIYSKGTSLAEYLLQVPLFLSAIIFARSAVAKNDKLFSVKITQLLRLSSMITIIGSVVLLLLSNYIILGLFGADFFESGRVLKFLTPGILFLTIFTVLNMDIAGKGKPWLAVKAMVPALIINIILNLVLIPDYGSSGAALSSTFSYFIASLLFLILYSRETKIPIKQIIMIKKTDFIVFKDLIKKLKQ
ncbi:oligosaccharide flippase family protein [Winogradskyella pulchriflava]|uniref:Polysaccharide biosynthesis C-terminal domain-containing protein n=1 Tax=Winogradskyella pulchriflava TaxID=1110688 RepID=A0ABV6Q848_9FLAO